MDCDVAREALSARIDREREPVPSARVDEHLETCKACATWYLLVSQQADQLRRLAAAPPRIGLVPAPLERTARGVFAGLTPRFGRLWQRWALALVGVAQLALGVAQAVGANLGMPIGHHGETSGVHLLNESTAWSVALGAVMIAAALRPSAAAGLAGVLAVFTSALAIYVIADSIAGLVTPARVLSHLPVVLGTVLALLVWRAHQRPDDPSPRRDSSTADTMVALAAVEDSTSPSAARGRRRGQLRPNDGSAA